MTCLVESENDLPVGPYMRSARFHFFPLLRHTVRTWNFWGEISEYTYLQNKRMRRCGVPPPPIIFERLKLP